MKETTKNKTRRTFLSETGMVAAGFTLGASSISSKSYSRIIGANDKVRVGFIGVGNRGSQVMHEFRGTHGTLYAGGSNDYKIVPATSGQFQDWEKMMDAEDYEVEKAGNGKLVDGTYANPGANLVRNFLDCVKSRQMPVVSLEEGHLSTSMAHLATISLQVNQTLKWDGEKEIVTNSEKANELLSYEYRKPWKL